MTLIALEALIAAILLGHSHESEIGLVAIGGWNGVLGSLFALFHLDVALGVHRVQVVNCLLGSFLQLLDVSIPITGSHLGNGYALWAAAILPIMLFKGPM